MRVAPELAEGIATFALVLVGCGAIMMDSATSGPLGHLGVSLAFGLVITAMVYATGHVSGAHINPAVTLAFAATGHFPWRRVPSYVLAQCFGSLAAVAVLGWILGDIGAFGATRPHEGLVGVPEAAVVELLITAILMFVISSVATDGRAVAPMAGIAIGASVAMMSLWAGPLTGASMNPARSLGPAIASGDLTILPLYLLAPTAGALLGAWAYDVTRRGARPAGRKA